jgi:hypothetical protein
LITQKIDIRDRKLKNLELDQDAHVIGCPGHLVAPFGVHVAGHAVAPPVMEKAAPLVVHIAPIPAVRNYQRAILKDKSVASGSLASLYGSQNSYMPACYVPNGTELYVLFVNENNYNHYPHSVQVEAVSDGGKRGYVNKSNLEFLPLHAVAQQADGYPDVILSNQPSSQGAKVSRVPNGYQLLCLKMDNEYTLVQLTTGEEYWARTSNLIIQYDKGVVEAPPATAALITAPAAPVLFGVAQQREGHLDIILRHQPTGEIAHRVRNGTELEIIKQDDTYSEVRVKDKPTIGGWVKSYNIQIKP